MILRDYQKNGIALVKASMRKGNKRIVLYSPTGSAMAMAIIQMALEKNSRVAFLVNRKALVHQFSLALDRLGVRHDVAQGVNTWMNGRPVLVATIQTIARRGLADVDFVIIDEAHGVPGSKEYRELIFSLGGKPVIGLTATPFSKGMAKPYPELNGPLFQDLIVVSTIKKLIAQGFLVDCDIFSPSEPDLKGIKLQKNSFGEMDYSEKELGKAVDKPDLIGDIVKHWIRLGKGKQTVVFATNISHSRHIVDQFCAAGVKAEHIDGYMEDEERDGIAKRFEKGDTTVISNVAVLREGWDVPACEVMILARPTRSLTTWIQMAGRVIRPSEGKGRALILDHSGSVHRMGYPTDDLPLELCDGSAKLAKKQAPKEVTESKCPKCHYVKKTFVCGNCGHAPTIEHGVKHAAGELKAVEKKKAYSHDEKQQIWSSALGLAAMRGRSQGWASHLYRSMTGVWPRGLVDEACHPSEKVKNMATRNAIAYARSRDSHAS
jgi:superfamily II DNA or RNA helicase